VSDSLLVLEGVSKGFERGPGRHVLAGASLSLRAGEIGVVVASRAQGKSTLLRVVAGMVPVDEGAVSFGGRDLKSLSDEERACLLGGEIGWACRGGPGGLRLEVRDYVGLPLVTGRRLRSTEPERLALRALERLGVGRCARLQWGELSDWERVRVELAQAVVGGPRLLLVDDLLSGLSMGRVREGMLLIRSLVAEDGFGVLMAASDGEPALFADRAWMLEEGELTLMDETAAAGEDPTVIEFPERGRRGSRA
jgi:putative ABC transport system ATP-binding protein